MSNKPFVRYLRTEDNAGYRISQYLGIEKPEYTVAFIDQVLDHPKLGRAAVRTSTVVEVREGGVIETRNTIYVPVMTEEETVN